MPSDNSIISRKDEQNEKNEKHKKYCIQIPDLLRSSPCLRPPAGSQHPLTYSKNTCFSTQIMRLQRKSQP